MDNAKLALALLALSSCTLVAKARGTSTPTSTPTTPPSSSDAVPSSTPSAGAAPTPDSHVSADDDNDTQLAMKQLDAVEKELTENHLARYALSSRSFRNTFMLHNGWSDSKKRGVILARIDALDARAIKTLGGRFAAAVVDSHRVLKLDPDAIEADVEMIETCQKAAKTTTTGQGTASADLAKAVAAYEKSMARAVKIDANALHYIGEGKGGDSLDVPTQLMECEVSLSGAATQFADEYAPETAPTEVEKGCGVIEWTANAVSLGGGRWGEYSRTQGSSSYAEKLPCGKLAHHSSFGKGLAASVRDFADSVELNPSQIVVAIDGAPYTEVSDEDLHTYRYQKMKAYSKDFTFAKNPCGAGKVFCEAGGSQAMARYNRMEFALDRAAAHAGQDAELCKAKLKEVRKEAKWFEDFHKHAVMMKSWVAGASYKSKKGATLTEQQLIDSFAAEGQTADDHLTDHFCSKKS